MATPNPSQARVLSAIEIHWRRHGTSPTIRDLQRAFNERTPHGMAAHLHTMARHGFIELDESRGVWPAGWRDKIRAACATAPATDGRTLDVRGA